MVKRWIDDTAITTAVEQPPQTTRAKLRGEFLATARELNAAITVDWTRMKVNRPEPMTEEFSEPFVSADPRLDGLLDYMRSHHSV